MAPWLASGNDNSWPVELLKQYNYSMERKFWIGEYLTTRSVTAAASANLFSHSEETLNENTEIMNERNENKNYKNTVIIRFYACTNLSRVYMCMYFNTIAHHSACHLFMFRTNRTSSLGIKVTFLFKTHWRLNPKVQVFLNPRIIFWTSLILIKDWHCFQQK